MANQIFKSINSFTLQVISEYPALGNVMIKISLEKAQKAYQISRFSTFEERREKMLNNDFFKFTLHI